MQREECTWDFRYGRDSEGELYQHHVLIHGSGRILAKVHAINYYFFVSFYFTAEKHVLNTDESYQFIDLISAQRFVEESVEKVDPLAPPKPKRARRARARVE